MQRRHAAHLATIVMVVAGLVVLPSPTSAVPLPPPLTQPACEDITASVTTFAEAATPMVDWAENLAFDRHGTLWVSRPRLDRLDRYDADGTLQANLSVPSPGGLAIGPDGLLYVHTADGTVRFDPNDTEGELPPPFTHVPNANGLAIDGDGNLYIGTENFNDFGKAPSVVRVRPDGTVDDAWTEEASFFGANGVTIAGDTLFAAISFDQRSPIQQVPIEAPATHRTFVELSAGVVSFEPSVFVPSVPPGPVAPKGLDDLTVSADGNALYVAAWLIGELLRVDLATGHACLVTGDLVTPTSVRVPGCRSTRPGPARACHPGPGERRGAPAETATFGGLDPASHLFVTEATGRVRHVTLHER